MCDIGVYFRFFKNISKHPLRLTGNPSNSFQEMREKSGEDVENGFANFFLDSADIFMHRLSMERSDMLGRPVFMKGCTRALGVQVGCSLYHLPLLPADSFLQDCLCNTLRY